MTDLAAKKLNCKERKDEGKRVFFGFHRTIQEGMNYFVSYTKITCNS